MSKVNDKLVRTMLFMQDCMILSMIETHPDPEKLLAHFMSISDQMIGISSGSECDDAFVNLLGSKQKSYESRLREVIDRKKADH